MRILYLSPWFPYPLDTGSRTRVHYLVRALTENHKVTLLALDPQGWAPAEVEKMKPFCEHLAVVPRDPFRRSRLRMATRFLSPRPVVADPFPEMSQMVREMHARVSFDMVIASTFVMADYVKELTGIVAVLEEHNALPDWRYEQFQSQTSLGGRFRHWLSWRKSLYYSTRLYSRFDMVTMVSEQDARATRALLKSGRPRVEVFSNGVDCRMFEPDRAAKVANRLVFSGSLAYRPNYEAMLYFLSEVLPLVRNQVPEAHLHITGSTENVDVSGLPIDEQVTLTGYLEDIRPEISAAEVAVAPILSGGGTRIKILEAMALGAPVVASPKGAEGLGAVDGIHIFLAGDPNKFAQRTVELLRNIELRSQLATEARTFVEKSYDWLSIGRRFASKLDDVMNAVS